MAVLCAIRNPLPGAMAHQAEQDPPNLVNLFHFYVHNKHHLLSNKLCSVPGVTTHIRRGPLPSGTCIRPAEIANHHSLTAPQYWGAVAVLCLLPNDYVSLKDSRMG